MPERSKTSRSSCCWRRCIQRYHYDFRHYARASIKRRLVQARDQLGFATISAMQDRVLHDPAMLPRLLDYPHRAGQRDVPRPVLLPGAAREGAAAPADLSVAEGLDRRLQHRRGALFAGHPVPRRRLYERTMFYATDINPEALAAAEAGVYALDRIRKFTENHQKSGGKSSLSDYYTAAYGRAAFDKSLREPRGVLRPQPGDRRGLRRDAPDLVPQRDDLFRSRRCRTAPSACSETPWPARASWAWARRRACASPATPAPSPTSCRGEDLPEARAMTAPPSSRRS
jgi:hypothetical protein